MRISRAKARHRVERATSETDNTLKSMAWDAAWSGIRALESRNWGEDRKVAMELTKKMRDAAQRGEDA